MTRTTFFPVQSALNKLSTILTKAENTFSSTTFKQLWEKLFIFIPLLCNVTMRVVIGLCSNSKKKIYDFSCCTETNLLVCCSSGTSVISSSSINWTPISRVFVWCETSLAAQFSDMTETLLKLIWYRSILFLLSNITEHQSAPWVCVRWLCLFVCYGVTAVKDLDWSRVEHTLKQFVFNLYICLHLNTTVTVKPKHQEMNRKYREKTQTNKTGCNHKHRW